MFHEPTPFPAGLSTPLWMPQCLVSSPVSSPVVTEFCYLIRFLAQALTDPWQIVFATGPLFGSRASHSSSSFPADAVVVGVVGLR